GSCRHRCAIQRGPHHVNGRLPAGPYLERRGTLVQKHGPPLGRPTAAQVEEDLVGSQQGRRRKVGGRGIDDEVRVGDRLLHVVYLNGAAADDLEVLAQAACVLEVARDNPDFGGRLQRGGTGSRGPPRADDHDTKAPTLTLPPKGGGKFLGEGAPESFDIGVPAFQSRARPADVFDRAPAAAL